MAIQYRPIITPEEIEMMVDLHGPIWSADDRDAIPSHMLKAIQHAGGILLGAYDQDRMIGFAVGMIGKRGGKYLHYSHAAGVLPAYQGRGVGSGIKWMQRELVLEQGFDCIAWTFDPLQRGNANFNIHRLGCICNEYHVNLYGQMPDQLNAGLPSDRFETRWWLLSERVCQRQKGSVPLPEVTDIHCVLAVDAHQGPGEIMWKDGERQLLVEIPDDLQRLKSYHPEVALQWRLNTRQVFTTLFSQGYTIVDFVSLTIENHRRNWYLLEMTG